MEQSPFCEANSCRSLLPEFDEAPLKYLAVDAYGTATLTGCRSHRREPFLVEINESNVHFVIVSVSFNNYFL
jgi:hypothetical protein